MRFFVHSGEDVQEVVERYDSATLALEAVSILAQRVPNIRVFNENAVEVFCNRTSTNRLASGRDQDDRRQQSLTLRV